jgi:hypothetical protein
VSVRFLGTQVITESTLLKSCVKHTRKISKIHIEEAIIDIHYLNAFRKSLGLQDEELQEDNQTLGHPEGDYFRSRVKEICLQNCQFHGESGPKRNFAIMKFVQTLAQFTNLESLTLKSLQSFAAQFVKALATTGNFPMAETLKHLQINSCFLKEETNTDENWVVMEDTISDTETFQHLRNFILRFDKLKSLKLIGLSMVDHLQDLTTAIKRPQLKKLSLPYNGIEQEYCTYFVHILNYETM